MLQVNVRNLHVHHDLLASTEVGPILHDDCNKRKEEMMWWDLGLGFQRYGLGELRDTHQFTVLVCCVTVVTCIYAYFVIDSI